MPYTHITWENRVVEGGQVITEGTKLNATNMNNIEDAVDSQRKYPTAGGTATAITVTAYHFSLTDGCAITFIAAASNSGAATTINVNSLGAKNAYKPGTTDAPNIIAGKAYTFWYSEGNNCFFVKASAEGNAVASEVLAGKTFSNDFDTGITGTMPNNGSNNIQAQLGSDVTIPAGYYDGSGKVLKPTVSAGTYIIGGSPLNYNNTVSTTSASLVKTCGMTVGIAGVYTVSFSLYGSLSGSVAYGQIYVNNVARGTLRSVTGTTAQTFSEDITVNVGDEIQLYMKVEVEGSAVSNYFALKTSSVIANFVKYV